MADTLQSWRERIAAAPELLRSSRAVAACAAAGGLLVAVALIVVAARGAPASPEVVLPMAPGASSTLPAGPSPTAPVGGDGQVLVDAAGAVARPGVYRVPPDGRVTDVLDAAGGPLPDADLEQLNLAAKVADGDRVYVPHRGQPPPIVVGTGGSAPGPAAPLDLNAATADQLDGLPGVGPATAQAIVDYRAEHGRFRSVDDLADVRGIGPAKLAALRPKVRV